MKRDKKPALKRVQKPTSALFLCLITLHFNLAFDSKLNGFLELMVEHFYVEFNHPICIGF